MFDPALEEKKDYLIHGEVRPDHGSRELSEAYRGGSAPIRDTASFKSGLSPRAPSPTRATQPNSQGRSNGSLIDSFRKKNQANARIRADAANDPEDQGAASTKNYWSAPLENGAVPGEASRFEGERYGVYIEHENGHG